jgi:hypothetical protein
LVCIVLVVVDFITEHALMQTPRVQEGGLILATSSSEKWRGKISSLKLHLAPFAQTSAQFRTLRQSTYCCICHARTRDLRAEKLGG